MEPPRHVVSNDPAQALKLMAEIYASRFIGLRDLKEAGKPVTLKIKTVLVEQLESIVLDGRRIEGGDRGILVFDRPSGKCELILNKTSYRALQRAWGKDPKAWIGSQVTVKLGKVNGKEATLVEPCEKAVPTLPPITLPGGDDLEFPEDRIPKEE